MKIAIYGQNYANESVGDALMKLLKALPKQEDSLYIESHFFELYKKSIDPFSVKIFSQLDSSFDLLVSIGGDGTILRAVTYVKNLDIPIVGINTGRLGFLATIQPDDISQAFSDISKGHYKLSKRALLAVETEPKHPNFEETNFALNEITVSRKNTTSMITVDTHLDDEYLTSYWADGLIVATPTGSTGYSLSCGGPVISPTAGNFVLTPIAPHNLNARPLVIPDTTFIELKVHGREDEFLLSLDSRIVTLTNSTILKVAKANFCIKMVELLDESFIDTLRKKMLWGEDRRN